MSKTRNTVHYYAYLAWQRNNQIQQKTAAYNEAQSWKTQKYQGRADVCFEEYAKLKASLASDLPFFKNAAKVCNVKPILGQDMMVTGIEQKVNGRWTTLAKSLEDIKKMAEDYIVESVILGEGIDGSTSDPTSPTNP